MYAIRSYYGELFRENIRDQRFHLRAFRADDFLYTILRDGIANGITRRRTHDLIFVTILPIDVQLDNFGSVD